MTAAELLDNLNRAGSTLEVVDGKPRLRGAKLTDELMQALKANRTEVLAEFERRKLEDRDRYGRVPPPDAPLLARELHVPELWKPRIMAHVLRQPRPVHAWVMGRANKYFEQGVTADDCEWRACVDVIAWQRMADGLEAAEFVVELLHLYDVAILECRKKFGDNPQATLFYKKWRHPPKGAAT